MTITLYYFPPSPPCRSAMLTLSNLGVDFDIKITNLQAGDHKTEEFTKLNPQRTVPTVVDDDFAMCESRAIAAYLVNAHGPDSSLYPAEPKARYIIDHRLYYDATVFMPRLLDAVRPVLFGDETVINPEKKEKIFACLDTLEGFLDGQDWFSASENVAICDFALLASFATLVNIGLDLANYPNLAGWYERCAELPGYDKNEEGARMFAGGFKAKLTEPF